MRKKVINYFMSQIKKKDIYDKVKLEEIKYGLEGLYSLITKTIVILSLSIALNIFGKLILFCLFFIPLRSAGFGTHAKSNLQCWIFSTVFLLGIPYLFSFLKMSTLIKIILWILCFINFAIFCPADTEKRPMINKKRKLKFKILILLISIIYLFLLLQYKSIANYILSAMVLQTILTNPIGYKIMGQQIRFRLNYIDLNKNRLEVQK